MEVLTEEYLRSMSLIAHKIGQDVDAARDAYQELWHTLDPRQREQVLNEAIIDPAAVLKYASVGAACNGNLQDNIPMNRNKFSWFTRSQLNLFTDESLRRPKKTMEAVRTAEADDVTPTSLPATEAQKTKDPNQNLLSKIRSKVTNLKMPSATEDKQSLVEGGRQAFNVVKSAPSKPKTPPPPPPAKMAAGSEKKALLSAVDIESDHDDIPKTGFDFLDNW